jgi:hypothetical protein
MLALVLLISGTVISSFGLATHLGWQSSVAGIAHGPWAGAIRVRLAITRGALILGPILVMASLAIRLSAP